MLLPSNFDLYSNGVLFSDGELINSCKALGWFRDYDSNIVHNLVQQFQGNIWTSCLLWIVRAVRGYPFATMAQRTSHHKKMPIEQVLIQ